MTKSKFQFEDPDSGQSLAEGLEEYYAKNPGLKRQSQLLSEEARQFYRGHDTVHVVYGCGTSMPDEAIVKLSSIFGTTKGLGVLRGYIHHEVLDIYLNLPIGSTVIALLISPFLLTRTIIRCLRQTKRWPWLEHQEFNNVPLHAIREEFRIKVAHATQSGAA